MDGWGGRWSRPDGPGQYSIQPATMVPVGWLHGRTGIWMGGCINTWISGANPHKTLAFTPKTIDTIGGFLQIFPFIQFGDCMDDWVLASCPFVPTCPFRPAVPAVPGGVLNLPIAGKDPDDLFESAAGTGVFGVSGGAMAGAPSPMWRRNP